MAENNIKQLLRCLCLPYQAIEDALQQLLSGRGPADAVGAQLDVVGAIVGEDREGETDDEAYRRRNFGRIAVNRSHGRVTDVIRVTRLVLTDYPDAEIVLDHLGEGDLVVKIGGAALPDDVADVLIKFLRLAVSDGVRVILESSTLAPANWFTWDVDGLGWDEGEFVNARDSVQG